jgi:signal transduction histidine kinase
LLGVEDVQIWLGDGSMDSLRLGARVPNGVAGVPAISPVGSGIVRAVLCSGRPLVTHELAHDPLWGAEVPVVERPRTGLLVPLLHGERLLGAFVALTAAERTFDEADISAIQALAIQVAAVVHDSPSRRREPVHDAGADTIRQVDLSAVLQITIRRAVDLVGASSGVIRLWDDESQSMVPRAWHGLPDEMPPPAIRLADGTADPGTVLAEPILSQGRLFGDIALIKEAGGALTPHDRELLGVLAGQDADAVESVRLQRELARGERQLEDLAGRLVEAREEERRRVAYDVHDGLAQVTVAAQQHLEALAACYQPRSVRARQELALARELALRAVREARRVIAGLRPTVLEESGLATALRLEVEALQADGWQVTYVEDLGGERLAPTIEISLYRVAQEALANARKHARTSRAQLVLHRREHAIRVEVRDWGCGFQPDDLSGAGRSGERFGLLAMRERIALIGGQRDVHSRPGAGTRIVVEVPLSTPLGRAACGA